jgi:succinoglycan biosynthesis transport protein ExoP
MAKRRLLSLARPWWVVVLAPVTGALLAYAYESRVPPVYEAHAILLASSPTGRSSPEAVAAQIPTYAELVNSGPLLRAALDRLGLRINPDELEPNVRGESDSATRLLTVRVRSKDPAVATSLANALARELARRVASGAAPAGSRPDGDVRLVVVQPASHASRVRPRVFLSAAYGALAGLWAGLAVAALLASTRRTVRGEDDLARLTPFPVLGSVNGARLWSPRDQILPADEAGAASYRRLSARILSGNGVRAPHTLLLVGAQGNEGSAELAARLALAVAETLGRVVLADLSRERATTPLFRIDEESASSLVKRSNPIRHGSMRLERFVLRAGPPLVLVLPRARGEWPNEPVAARGVLALLLTEADFVFVYAPSLGSSPAMLGWARAVDATVLVVRRASTRRESVLSAVEALDLARSNVVGTVLHQGHN